MPNPGLVPWAMQEYRPKGLFDVFTTNQLLAYFDVLTLKKAPPFYPYRQDNTSKQQKTPLFLPTSARKEYLRLTFQ